VLHTHLTEACNFRIDACSRRVYHVLVMQHSLISDYYYSACIVLVFFSFHFFVFNFHILQFLMKILFQP
jgi:hypothetical protein